MDNILDPRQEKYLNWLMQPVGYRVPTSQEKYALEEGVDETTLRRWKKKPAFKLEWERRVGELQQSLSKWTSEKWTTKSGKPSTQGPKATGERYLPTKAIKKLTPAQYAATTAAKRKGTKAGKQFVPNTPAAKKAGKKARTA